MLLTLPLFSNVRSTFPISYFLPTIHPLPEWKEKAVLIARGFLFLTFWILPSSWVRVQGRNGLGVHALAG
jgi:hypothetical protein